MPPKKKGKQDKPGQSAPNPHEAKLNELEAMDDGTGIPKNACTFKIKFEIEQLNVENCMIQMNFISSDKPDELQVIQTSLIDQWEEKVDESKVDQDTTTAVKPKKDKKDKKDKKKDKKQVKEDADEEPEEAKTVQYEQIIGPFRIDDKFAETLCKTNFYMYLIDTAENQVKQEIYFDYSPFLFPKKPQSIKHSSDKMLIQAIENFNFSMTPNKALLSKAHRSFLNPLRLHVVGAKQLPTVNENKYLPVYVSVKFFNGDLVKTHSVPHDSVCKWKFKHVFLVGKEDPVWFKEQLKKHMLKFEFHDKDEIKKDDVKKQVNLIEIEEEEEEEEEEEAVQAKGKGKKGKKAEKEKGNAKDKGKKEKKEVKGGELTFAQPKQETISNNYGVAQFMLTDLLKPNLQKLKLLSPIAPIKKFEDNSFTNLDLNTTARKELKKLIVLTSYLDLGSYLVICLDIAEAIGKYQEDQKNKPKEEVVVDPEEEKQKEVKKKQDSKKKKKTKADKQAKGPKGKKVVEEGSEDKKKLLETQKLQEFKNQKKNSIYERAIYIIPYKSKALVDKIQKAHEILNCKGLKYVGGGERELNTHMLTELERANRELDVITGFELIDSQRRMYVFEGLRDGAMSQIEKYLPVEKPNSKELIILKNKGVTFQNRLYTDFNAVIRRIKLRKPLNKIILNPNIYLRTKVAENIYQTISKLHELRIAPNIQSTMNFDSYPTSDNLEQLERKYGDSLTDMDLYCVQKRKKVVKAEGAKRVDFSIDKSSYQTGENSTTRPTQKSMLMRLNFTIGESKIFEAEKQVELTNITNRIAKNYQTYNMHMKQLLDIPEKEEIYIYGGQRLNFYTMQKTHQRQRIQKDPKHFYTYSKAHLGLSIDPQDLNDVKRSEKLSHTQKMKTKNGFQPLPKRDKLSTFISPKQLHYSQIEDLKHNPYYMTRENAELINNPTRGLPISNPNKKEFQSKVQSIKYFSLPEIIEGQKLSAAEAERQIIEDRRREYETWRKKIIVDKTYLTVNTIVKNRPLQLDKLKGIRKGKAIKKGYLLKPQKISKSNITLTKFVKNPPSTIFADIKYVDAGKNIMERVSRKEDNITDKMWAVNSRPDINYGSPVVYKPLNRLL